MKRYFLIAAVAATALVACTKTFDHNKSVNEGAPISLSTWSDVMTKAYDGSAPITSFASGDEFEVFGYKWKTGPTGETPVFWGDEVLSDGTNWTYSPLRYWDQSYDNYTFFAVWPKDVVPVPDGQTDLKCYSQTGTFATSEITFDGTAEKLLIAQKKTVAKTNYNTVVPLVFKHMGALVDVKVKKHEDLATATLEVTGITLSNIKTKGTFTVASYDGSNNPVGAWTPDATPTVANFTNTTGTGVATLPTLAATTLPDKTGCSTATAGDLIENFVVMPQALDGTQTLTITYTLEDESGIVNTYAPAAIGLDKFDNTDNKSNASTFITAWQPGYHYTLYVTINANAIEFSATIDGWVTADDGFHYILN